jgi:hypothetical protein
MTYQKALKAANKVGAAHAQGLPLLAQTIFCFAAACPINGQLAYDGARKKGLTADQVRKMTSVQVGDLMFA